MSDEKCGGPNWTDELCRKCLSTWRRYRSGSYDWKYEHCLSCRATEKPKQPDTGDRGAYEAQSASCPQPREWFISMNSFLTKNNSGGEMYAH